MSEHELTGKRRYRILAEKIILQVELRYLHTYWTAGSIDSEWRTYFRDAKLQDISLHELEDIKNA